MKRNPRGFSLIELLIVVAIILIIAAIAIPNFLKSRMAANQAAAVQAVRVLNSAEASYYSTYGGTFSSTLAQLGPPASGPATAANADVVDAVLATGIKSGYTFIYTPLNLDSAGNYMGYRINANPIQFGTTGIVYYFTDQSYVIRQNSAAAATSSDSPLAG